jgi:hypothetical protein
MNSYTRNAWGVAVAAFALSVTTGCGSEIAPGPADIPPIETKSPSPDGPGTPGGQGRRGYMPEAWS